MMMHDAFRVVVSAMTDYFSRPLAESSSITTTRGKNKHNVEASPVVSWCVLGGLVLFVCDQYAIPVHVHVYVLEYTVYWCW